MILKNGIEIIDSPYLPAKMLCIKEREAYRCETRMTLKHGLFHWAWHLPFPLTYNMILEAWDV